MDKDVGDFASSSNGPIAHDEDQDSCDNDSETDGSSVSGSDESGSSDDSEDGSTGSEDESDGSDTSGDMNVERCPICLHRFGGQLIGTPESCDHSFCLECIKEWSNAVSTCPVDRHPFSLLLVRHDLMGKIVDRLDVQPRRATEEEEEADTFCEVCGRSDNEDRLLLCDGCDNGYHLECLDPPLSEVPRDEWYCCDCATENENELADEVEIYPDEVSSLINDSFVPPPCSLPERRTSRLVPRTRQSERIRETIRRGRQEASRRAREEPAAEGSATLSDTINGVANSTEPLVYHPPPPGSGKVTKRRKRRVYRRRKKRKSSACRKTKKASTNSKKTSGVLKTKTKRKSTGTKRKGKFVRRKRRFKKGRRCRLKIAAKPQTPHGRIAEYLGVRRVPISPYGLPQIQKSEGRGRAFRMSDNPLLPDLQLFGDRNALDSYVEDEENVMGGGLAAVRVAGRSGVGGLANRKRMLIANRLSAPPFSEQPATGFDLLGSILDSQSTILDKKSLRNVTVSRDGTLKYARKAAGVTTPEDQPQRHNDAATDSGTTPAGSANTQQSCLPDNQGGSAGNQTGGRSTAGYENTPGYVNNTTLNISWDPLPQNKRQKEVKKDEAAKKYDSDDVDIYSDIEDGFEGSEFDAYQAPHVVDTRGEDKAEGGGACEDVGLDTDEEGGDLVIDVNKMSTSEDAKPAEVDEAYSPTDNLSLNPAESQDAYDSRLSARSPSMSDAANGNSCSKQSGNFGDVSVTTEEGGADEEEEAMQLSADFIDDNARDIHDSNSVQHYGNIPEPQPIPAMRIGNAIRKRDDLDMFQAPDISNSNEEEASQDREQAEPEIHDPEPESDAENSNASKNDYVYSPSRPIVSDNESSRDASNVGGRVAEEGASLDGIPLPGVDLIPLPDVMAIPLPVVQVAAVPVARSAPVPVVQQTIQFHLKSKKPAKVKPSDADIEAKIALLFNSDDDSNQEPTQSTATAAIVARAEPAALGPGFRPTVIPAAVIQPREEGEIAEDVAIADDDGGRQGGAKNDDDDIILCEDQEEGEIVELSSTVKRRRRPLKRRRNCPAEVITLDLDDEISREPLPPDEASRESVSEPQQQEETEEVEHSKTDRPEMIEGSVEWKKVNRTKGRSYRDGKPKDASLLFQEREIKKKKAIKKKKKLQAEVEKAAADAAEAEAEAAPVIADDPPPPSHKRRISDTSAKKRRRRSSERALSKENREKERRRSSSARGRRQRAEQVARSRSRDRAVRRAAETTRDRREASPRKRRISDDRDKRRGDGTRSPGRSSRKTKPEARPQRSRSNSRRRRESRTLKERNSSSRRRSGQRRSGRHEGEEAEEQSGRRRSRREPEPRKRSRRSSSHRHNDPSPPGRHYVEELPADPSPERRVILTEDEEGQIKSSHHKHHHHHHHKHKHRKRTTNSATSEAGEGTVVEEEAREGLSTEREKVASLLYPSEVGPESKEVYAEGDRIVINVNFSRQGGSASPSKKPKKKKGKKRCKLHQKLAELTSAAAAEATPPQDEDNENDSSQGAEPVVEERRDPEEEEQEAAVGCRKPVKFSIATQKQTLGKPSWKPPSPPDEGSTDGTAAKSKGDKGAKDAYDPFDPTKSPLGSPQTPTMDEKTDLDMEIDSQDERNDPPLPQDTSSQPPQPPEPDKITFALQSVAAKRSHPEQSSAEPPTTTTVPQPPPVTAAPLAPPPTTQAGVIHQLMHNIRIPPPNFGLPPPTMQHPVVWAGQQFHPGSATMIRAAPIAAFLQAHRPPHGTPFNPILHNQAVVAAAAAQLAMMVRPGMAQQSLVSVQPQQGVPLVVQTPGAQRMSQGVNGDRSGSHKGSNAGPSLYEDDDVIDMDVESNGGSPPSPVADTPTSSLIGSGHHRTANKPPTAAVAPSRITQPAHQVSASKSTPTGRDPFDSMMASGSSRWDPVSKPVNAAISSTGQFKVAGKAVQKDNQRHPKTTQTPVKTTTSTTASSSALKRTSTTTTAGAKCSSMSLLGVSARTHKSSRSSAGAAATSLGKKEVTVKVDDHQLKVMDDLPSSAVELSVKEKFMKKLNRQERVVEEVKLVLKPYYSKRVVTKEEYKEVLRKTVPKICHNRSGEINPVKIKAMVETYVKKFKHKRKREKSDKRKLGLDSRAVVAGWLAESPMVSSD